MKQPVSIDACDGVHAHCQACLLDWFTKCPNRSCPICRTQSKGQDDLIVAPRVVLALVRLKDLYNIDQLNEEDSIDDNDHCHSER